MPNSLIAPHGGRLVDPMADRARAGRLKAESKNWPSWDLTARQLCDIELLMTGGFSPLNGFMNRADYDAVCGGMRLADGTLWPIPITLDITEELACGLKKGDPLVLRDPEGVMLAVLRVEELWKPDREKESGLSTTPSIPGIPQSAICWRKAIPGTWAGLSKGYSCRNTTTFPRCGSGRRPLEATLPGWDGAGSSLSKPATPCTAPTTR